MPEWSNEMILSYNCIQFWVFRTWCLFDNFGFFNGVLFPIFSKKGQCCHFSAIHYLEENQVNPPSEYDFDKAWVLNAQEYAVQPIAFLNDYILV